MSCPRATIAANLDDEAVNKTSVEPRVFFDLHVLPNYSEWTKNPLEIHLAMNAVSNANNMADYMFRRLKQTGCKDVVGCQNVASYRDYLADAVCKEFAFVRDIADAHKHAILSRSNRNITQHSQTRKIYRGVWPKGMWAKGMWAKGMWFEKEEILVSLDSGEQKPLSQILPQVIEMWRRLLDGCVP